MTHEINRRNYYKHIENDKNKKRKSNLKKEKKNRVNSDRKKYNLYIDKV